MCYDVKRLSVIGGTLVLGDVSMSEKGDGFQWEIAEWFDHHGNRHDGSPSAAQLLRATEKLEIHAWDANGSDIYWTVHSGGTGWSLRQLAEDVDIAWNSFTWQPTTDTDIAIAAIRTAENDPL